MKNHLQSILLYYILYHFEIKNHLQSDKNVVYALWEEVPKLMYALSICKPVYYMQEINHFECLKLYVTVVKYRGHLYQK